MTTTDAGRGRRSLSRDTIVARALEIGDAEGLDGVSVRRLAADLGVTPMALYRHVKDKQDLLNAMTEVVIDQIDVAAGIEPSMAWTQRMRLAIQNYKDALDARPLALTLSIAYDGDGPPGFWRMLDDLLGILLGAGFGQRQAVILIRAVSNLLAGYLLLLRADPDRRWAQLDEVGMATLRKQFELTQLRLPRDQFPNLAGSADEVAEVWLSDPDRWWQDTVDLLVFGLERVLERSTSAGAGAPS